MVEFPTSTASGSARIFEEAFGWQHSEYGPEYTDVQLDGEQSLGFQQDAAEAPSGPLTIIEVDDLDATRRSVEAAGGVVTTAPFDFPGGTRFHFREPGGNVLAAWVRRP
ncbi:glyoxalase/bleomycin resistance/extradiol dioxygenase family protein [Tomitella cavernea]|uniref:Glyoxalase/bleomycin resistance/extradiol dioxygenase family protein n=2 Tax=Tomitella cavernea TaxID=1387982 RepID=A0ABP9CZL2_9ACTN